MIPSLNQGTANRTIAATNMNATSSRAHTLVCISFDQITSTNGATKRLSSAINFVDLAGKLIHSMLSQHGKTPIMVESSSDVNAFYFELTRH